MSLKRTLGRVYSAVRNKPEGYVDTIERGSIIGWAFDPSAPSRIVDVEVFVDGANAGLFAANRFRADLSQSGKGDGHHGFEIPVPPAALDGQPHRLELRVAGTRRVLRGSRRTFTAAGHSTPAPSATERMGVARVQFNPGLPPPDLAAGLPAGKDDPRAQQAAAQPLSVVIPTYNRGAALEETLRVAIAHARGLDVEFVVVDDGSADDTPRRLSGLAREFACLRWKRVDNGGPGQARNAGIAMARHSLVLLMGDDTRPASADFFLHHIRAHQWMPGAEIAVLGKIVWPNHPAEKISFVMSHIQGAGQEQFGYFALMPYTWLDWRFFYTANISFKKSLVDDWTTGGFSAEFPLARYEDGELAYRLNKKLEGKFRILYTPAATVAHHHPYGVADFMRRQISCGLMSRVFARLHPEIAPDLGIASIDRALALPDPGREPIDDFLSMIEGIKSWAKVIDRHYQLGSQNWHTEFLRAVFEMCYLQGCVMGHDQPGGNLAAAYRFVLERFQERMESVAAFEAFGRLLRMPVV